MIVDKINKYLTENETIVNESLRYEVEKLAGVCFRRQFMESNERETKGKLYLSGAGKCARQLAYGYHGFDKKGKEIDSRSKVIFFQGDLTELMVVSIAKLAGCNLTATGLNQITVAFKVNGEEVYGHPDGLLLDSEIILIEIKSMSSFGFKRFQEGEVDETYLAQINCYLEALGLNKCVMVALNKDNGVLHEQIIIKDKKIIEQCRARLKGVMNSIPEVLPDAEYKANDKGFYPWQCLYCSWWGLCRPNAEKVLVGKSYKLKEKTNGTNANPTSDRN